MENKKALVWLRDDFRINRNNALVYASENHEQVSAIYIFNPEEYENKREAQRWWIYHSLINFKQELSKFNISLELLVGDEAKFFNKIKKNEEIHLYWNKIPEPEEENKEKKIMKNLDEKKINYKFFKGNVLSEYQEVTKDDGTPFKVLSGLVEEFGTERVIDTPISEPGFTGIAVGAAMTGLRPIVDLMFGDFLFLIMDQLCNQAAKTHYMSGGKLSVPMVLRTNMGATRRSAAQHSQSLQALVAHIPGLKVAMPSSAYEAKGLMKTAIRDNNPVVIFEDKLMYNDKAEVPEEEYLINFGEANILRPGTDITLIATSSMVQQAEMAANTLADQNISAEVIDPRTISPLDETTLINSVKKTSHAIVIDEGHQNYGITAEIAARISEKAFYYLDAPVQRLGAMDVPVPFSPVLEDLTVPTAQQIHERVVMVLEGKI